MQTAVVLLSGGIDSAFCAHLMQKQGFAVEGLFLDFAQAAATRERIASAAVAAQLGIPLRTQTLSGTPTRGAGELVGRNSLLISAGTFLMGARSGLVVIGIHAGTSYYDCSAAFVDRIGKLTEEQTDGKVRLIAPLLNWTKAEIVAEFLAAKLPIEITYSCEASDAPCGVCYSCKDRQVLGC